ncbi:MAG: hypothetical protein HY516_03375 [Candidatus Aenigmarchaeota archaeon]|nr:hypothetical protein [Candidatus Aenigmarchaeota archaeon]
MAGARLADSDHLEGIFYSVYDIKSTGVMPQIQLVNALMKGEHIDYHEEPPSDYHPSGLLRSDAKSNLFSNCLAVARTFDPSVYAGYDHVAPPEYFGEDGKTLRVMKRNLDAMSRRGRSFTLRSLAGLHADLAQPELTDGEASEVSRRLNEKYGLNTSMLRCLGFVTGYDDVVNRSVTPEETRAEINRASGIVYDFWNNAGRQERTQYHASKLELMGAITAATIKKAHSVGINPDTLARNDAKHALYWKQVYDEDVPLPGVLLTRAQIAVRGVFEKYPRV